MSVKQAKRIRRHVKIRKQIAGTQARPRFCVFKSNQHMYAQLVDDTTAKVLVSASDKDVKGSEKMKKAEIAKEVGKLVAEMAQEKKITTVVFDRAGFLFHGRIKAVAEGAREAGLKF